MSDLIFHPISALSVTRESGLPILGRMTTTEEQRRQAYDWALEKMRHAGTTELRFRVEWTRGEMTILDVRVNVEHLAGEVPFLTIGKVTEFSLSGAEITRTIAEKMQRTVEEVAVMVKSGEI